MNNEQAKVGLIAFGWGNFQLWILWLECSSRWPPTWSPGPLYDSRAEMLSRRAGSSISGENACRNGRSTPKLRGQSAPPNVQVFYFHYKQQGWLIPSLQQVELVCTLKLLAVAPDPRLAKYDSMVELELILACKRTARVIDLIKDANLHASREHGTEHGVMLGQGCNCGVMKRASHIQLHVLRTRPTNRGQFLLLRRYWHLMACHLPFLYLENEVSFATQRFRSSKLDDCMYVYVVLGKFYALLCPCRHQYSGSVELRYYDMSATFASGPAVGYVCSK